MDKLRNAPAPSGDIRKSIIDYWLNSPNSSESPRLSAAAMAELKLIPVEGISMLPALRPGDIIAAIPVGDIPPAPGEIVLLKRGNSDFVVHRVIESRSKSFLQTRGDSRLFKDAPVHWENCAGKVIGVWRGNKMVSLPPKPQFLARWLKIAELFLKRVVKKIVNLTS